MPAGWRRLFAMTDDVVRVPFEWDARKRATHPTRNAEYVRQQGRDYPTLRCSRHARHDVTVLHLHGPPSTSARCRAVPTGSRRQCTRYGSSGRAPRRQSATTATGTNEEAEASPLMGVVYVGSSAETDPAPEADHRKKIQRPLRFFMLALCRRCWCGFADRQVRCRLR